MGTNRFELRPAAGLPAVQGQPVTFGTGDRQRALFVRRGPVEVRTESPSSSRPINAERPSLWLESPPKILGFDPPGEAVI